MKTVIIILGMMSLVTQDASAFGSRRSSGNSTTPNVPTGPAQPTPPNSDVGTGGVRVVIQSAVNFNSSQAEHLEKSRVVLEKVLNSEEFKQRVLHFAYNGEETYVQNNGLNNLQIYNKIMSAAEEFPQQTVANNQMDLSVQIYTSSWFNRSVVGYTSPDTATIYMNTYFYNYATPAGTAGNMMHEWLHKLGFDHDFNSTARRPSTVPYAIGYIAEDLAEKY